MRARIDFKTPRSPAPQQLGPRPQRRAAAVIAQYIQDLLRAQTRAEIRPRSQAI